MPTYQSSAKMTQILFPKQLAELMAYKDQMFAGAIRLRAVHQAHLVLGTLRQFCQSAEEAMVQAHVPRSGRLLGARDEVIAEVCSWALEQAQNTSSACPS
jgi:hypothetical protein